MRGLSVSRHMAAILVGLTTSAVSAAATAAPAQQPKQAPAVESRARPLLGLTNFDAPSTVDISLFGETGRWINTRLTALGDCERGAVSFVPFEGLSPNLTLEGGSLFEIDRERIARPLGIGFAALERPGYSFGDAHFGLELGCPKVFRILLRGGFSMLISRPDAFRSLRYTPTARAHPSRTQLGASGRILLQFHI